MKKTLIGIILAAFVLFLTIGCQTTTTATTTATTPTSTETTSGTTTTTTTEGTGTTGTISDEMYQVTFEANGGSAVVSQTVEEGDLVSEPDSFRDDYSLLGWYSDEALSIPWDFSASTVTSDLTLYAKWEFTYRMAGEGTAESPYLVADVHDLEVLVTDAYPQNGDTFFLLTADLSFETVYADIEGAVFHGVFDGNGFTLALTGDAALFYENAGTIENLILSGDLETDSADSIGMLCHYNSGTLSGITAEGAGVRSLVGTVGTMEEGVGGAGAIAGTNLASGTITGCTSDTNVQARVGGGGIAGTNHGTITLSGQWGTVGESEVVYISIDGMSLAKFSYMGGIAGINDGTISQCQNRGRVFAQRAGNTAEVATNLNKVFGGIAGYNAATGTVTECYSAYGTAGATVHADRIVGGIVGQNLGTVSYCYTPANIGGRANLGGIVGLSDESETSVATVFNCWANSAFKSEGNETDEIGAFLSTDASNWYAIAKSCSNCYYKDGRGLAPLSGENNLSTASVSLDMTSVLNTGLEAGQEKFVATGGSSSGNAKTKLVWQKATVTFLVEGIETSVTVQMGDTPAFGDDPVKAGYDFAGWRRDPLDPATSWTPAGVTADLSVTAVFTPHEYSITYVLDGGELAAGYPETFTVESAEITLPVPTRAGCAFLNWKDGSGASVSVIPAGSAGDLVLTAEWQISVSYVTLHYVGYARGDETLLELEGAKVTLAVPEAEGFRFLGWSLDGTTVAFAGGADIAYADVSASASEGIVTLTALFQEIFTYTVHFEANGALGTMEDLTYETGTAYTLPAVGFSAAGYTFYGWSCGGVAVADQASVTDLAGSGLTATLTAQWYGGTSLVVNGDFADGGAFTSADSKTYTYGNWNVYRNGTTNVPSLAASSSTNELVVDATIATGATSLNFYVYTAVTLPGIAVGKTYYVSFQAKVNDASYDLIGVYIRSKAAGSTTYKTVADLYTYTSLDVAYAPISTFLTCTGNIADGSTYYLILPLAGASGGVAGTFTWTIDDVRLYEVGAVPAA